jgi:autophagy-related protein 9
MSEIVEPKSERPVHGVSESKIMSQDSDLHDYDMHGAKEDALESDTDENDVTNGGAGVLGMLQQFARAQTDKGRGVNI